jgi:Aldo/keto reductase family
MRKAKRTGDKARKVVTMENPRDLARRDAGSDGTFGDGRSAWLGRLGNVRNVVRQEMISRQLDKHLRMPSARVLDVGAGQGTQSIRLARAGHQVLAVEPASQFSKMQYLAQLHGWTRFVSMQNQCSLIQREDERQMFGLLADHGVGSIPWSPLAKGRLARPWGQQTARSDTDSLARWVLPHDDEPYCREGLQTSCRSARE